MNLHLPAFLKPKPVHVVPRFHAATKSENRAASAKAVGVQCELAIYVATVPLEQRRAEFQAVLERRG